jgi:YD repeat-containing protein
MGRVIAETNQLDATRLFADDALGNLVRKTDRNQRVSEFEYDIRNRLVAERWLDGQTVLRTIGYQYDAVGQLLEAADPDAAYSYQYDKCVPPLRLDEWPVNGYSRD